jgi:hypothetical protein
VLTKVTQDAYADPRLASLQQFSESLSNGARRDVAMSHPFQKSDPPTPAAVLIQPPILIDGVIALNTRTLADVDAQIAGQDADIVKWLNWDKPTPENVTSVIKNAVAD